MNTELVKEIMLALLQNPAIMMPVPSQLNPKMAQIQIVIDVPGTAIQIAEDFLNKTSPKNEEKQHNGLSILR